MAGFKELLNFIFVREKSQNLKYQVDYHLHSDEYKDLITGICL